MDTRNTAKKIRKGIWLYRGFVLTGSYQDSEHRMCWEAVDDDGSGFAHSFSLRETKQLVDWEIESNNHPEVKYNSIEEVDVNHIYKETDN